MRLPRQCASGIEGDYALHAKGRLDQKNSFAHTVCSSAPGSIPN